MASLDYFVATLARNAAVEAIEPNVLASLASGRRIELYGYTGMVKSKITYAIRRDGSRSLVAGTGYAAHDAATLFFSLSHKTDNISIARIDVQETIKVIDPDTTIVFLTPKKSYKATRISNVHGEGETLYVGSPSSRARLRIYNKSSESGITDGDLKFLRIEVQLRDVYADIAYGKWQNGRLDEVLVFWLRKMLQNSSANDIINLASMFSVNADFSSDELEDDWISRRKVWFEKNVVPALSKLFLAEPGYIETAKRKLFGGEICEAEDFGKTPDWTHLAEVNENECRDSTTK